MTLMRRFFWVNQNHESVGADTELIYIFPKKNKNNNESDKEPEVIGIRIK